MAYSTHNGITNHITNVKQLIANDIANCIDSDTANGIAKGISKDKANTNSTQKKMTAYDMSMTYITL